MSLPALDIQRLLREQPLYSFILAGDGDLFAALQDVKGELQGSPIGLAARSLVDGHSIKVVVTHESEDDQTANLERVKDIARRHGLAYAIFPALDDPPEFRLAVMDMDSTLIDQEVIEELADFAGVREHVARVTTAAMEGKLDFHQALRERVKLLAGQPDSILEETFQRRIKATDGLTELMAGYKKLGIKTAVVSGGFSAIVDRFAEKVGLDHALANTLEIVDGKLTGQVLGEIVGADVKQRTLLELCSKYRIEPGQAIAIGDGANDLKMMSVAGLGVAFCAKPIVQQQALAAINRRRLDDVLLFLA